MEYKPEIIFEDTSLFVLNKPSGWITNSASTTGNQPVVENWLADNFKFEIFNFKLLRHGIVHRLDKETSGVLLVAKTKTAFEDLQRQFKERVVKKTYMALVHGQVSPKEGDIKVAVGRLPWRRDRFGVLPGGRESSTHYKVISYHTLSTEHRSHLRDYSLIEFFPMTGRTHQIRIHAKHMGHPVVSDDFYAGRKTARADRLWCPRLFLHAHTISFLHPTKKDQVNFTSDLQDDLKIALKILETVPQRN